MSTISITKIDPIVAENAQPDQLNFGLDTMGGAFTKDENGVIKEIGGGGLSIFEITTNTSILSPNSFNLVTFSTGQINLTLPDATLNEGSVVKIKKRTGNDTYNVVIDSVGGLVEGLATVNFNFDRQVYGLIAISGNRYIK